ncbi:unnamed protein product [Rangifer tarandus platyrhynchus]|uniref:Uncharacterized protein n=1 Tax=Rangifer tarandus platyrhynchus TaxID=3082113 RepID=A0AC59ZTF0_RANTA
MLRGLPGDPGVEASTVSARGESRTTGFSDTLPTAAALAVAFQAGEAPVSQVGQPVSASHHEAERSWFALPLTRLTGDRDTSASPLSFSPEKAELLATSRQLRASLEDSKESKGREAEPGLVSFHPQQLGSDSAQREAGGSSSPTLAVHVDGGKEEVAVCLSFQCPVLHTCPEAPRGCRSW